MHLKRRFASTGKPRVRRTAILITATVCLTPLAACGGESSDDKGSTKSVTYAITSPVVPPQLPPYMGPVIYGKDFGIIVKESNLKKLNSTPTALQLLLSGKIDATSGAFLGYLQAREKQPQLRAFCPEQATTNAVVVSTNPKIKSLKDLGDKSVRVLVESPGGPNDFFMNEAFKASGSDLSVESLKNTRIVENMEQRFSSLAGKQADVGVVWNYNVSDLEKSVGKANVTVLANFADYPSVYLAYISSTKWLDAHQDEAAAFCAAVLKSNRENAASLDTFKKFIATYVEGKPPAEQIDMTWKAANESTMWPFESGLAQSDVDPLLKIARDNKLITTDLTYQDVVDPRPFKAALKLLADDAN